MSKAILKKIKDTLAERGSSYGSFKENAYNYYDCMFKLSDQKFMTGAEKIKTFYFSCIASKKLRLVNMEKIVEKTDYNRESEKDTYIDICGYTLLYLDGMGIDAPSFDASLNDNVKYDISYITEDLIKYDYKSLITKSIINYQLI